MVNALVNPAMPLEQVAEWKATIEDIVAQFETMEQEAKTITEATMEFWKIVVQDEQLDQFTM